MTTEKAEQVYCWKSEESTHIYTGVASAPVSSIRLISPEVCFPMAVCLRKNLEGRKKKKERTSARGNMQIFTVSEKSTSKAGDHKELETHFVRCTSLKSLR